MTPAAARASARQRARPRRPRRPAAAHRRARAVRVRDTHSDPDEIALRLGHGVRDEAAGKARVIFVTCGYLVRLVAHHPERLQDHTHVVIDEVHERTVDADVLCLLCRRLLELRPELRLVLMSATLAGGLYCDYFKCPPPIFVGAKRFPVDVVFADDIATGAVSRVVGHRFGGRTEAAALQAMRLANPQIEGAEQLQPWERKRKEVQEQRKQAAREKLEAEGAAGSSADDALEDAPHAELGKFQHELVVAVCCALARDASKSCALVFVPGMADIGDLTDRLEARGGAYVGDVAGTASEIRRFECVPVHSELPHEDQARAFAPATDGRFKVVLATNSAESSVTLPDCDDVLDLGAHKALRYDAASHRAVLAPAWPLDAVVLNLRAMIDAPVGPLLASTLEPPKTRHVERALAALRDAGLLRAPERSANAAASAEGALTPTGAFVAALGVDLRLGRLVALGWHHQGQGRARRARRGGARRAARPPPAPRATVLLAGDGARDLRARHVLGLFPPECLFRYDAGVRTTFTPAAVAGAAPAPSRALHDLAAHFSLSGAWCVFRRTPPPSTASSRRTRAAARAPPPPPGGVAGGAPPRGSRGTCSTCPAPPSSSTPSSTAASSTRPRAATTTSARGLLAPRPARRRPAGADLRSLLQALPAAVHCCYGARHEGVAATASFGGADARDDAKLEFALETTFFGADPLGPVPLGAPDPPGKPALRFAPDGEKGRQAWESGEPRPPLLNDLPVGARLLSAMAMGYRDNQLRVWADRPGGPPRYPGLPPEPPSRRAVAVKLDVPKPAWKLVFAPASAGASAPPSAQVLTPFHSLAAVAVHHAADDRDATVYAVAGAMVDTAGGGARAESVTVLPPGDEWLGLALRCARDPRSLPPDALEAKLAKAARPDLARAADAFRDAAAPRPGSARRAAARLAGLAAVFRPWLPAAAADDALAARLERLGPPSAGAVRRTPRGAIAQISLPAAPAPDARRDPRRSSRSHASSGSATEASTARKPDLRAEGETFVRFGRETMEL
ncbi:helicase [Aureococcus anophagefferens]|nr:helicase [Aureococcus anophagefferens]